MYINNKYRVKIKIDLDNGIYFFDTEASTGKTRLYTELKQIQRWDKDVIAYTYGEKQEGISLSEVIKRNPGRKVLMLDRYHMYLDDARDEIIEYSKNSIVLIDCKKANYWLGDCSMCSIDMTASSITVWE